ncbi:hypothetical protein PP175_28760 (plasmid) [Aneurinibacillus sp. Ricciae_BoGa-3]|uniref:hypothetical protein n=1 Tax=Aneurinibacillus sp. Ricciae_BoGa-3 TaxID=3022697 RepID=UPI00234261AC|nr:hypothetical protein [Aneurinibacillus sp. Ricciae_BoGa-3]WCK57182.1 hypothetical protein PP175_28760 [Aneurinibacillus sp. Ricciae_BoGa-3]
MVKVRIQENEKEVVFEAGIIEKAFLHHNIKLKDMIHLIEKKGEEILAVEYNEPILLVGDFSLTLYHTPTTIVVTKVFGQHAIL